MKLALHVLIVGLLFAQLGCEKEQIDPNAAKLKVEFTWEGMRPCGWGNPEIHVNGVPDQTKYLEISMYDHAYSHDHGTVLMPYAGEKIIAKNHFKTIQGPCPVYTPGRYEITIQALNGKKVIVGIGSFERAFPEKK